MINQDKLFQQVINLFSYRDRSEWEIRQYLKKKLRDKNQSESIINKIIKKLYHFDLLNDEKFVIKWIEARTKSKFHGPKRLYVDLYKKGISKQIINKHINKHSSHYWAKIAKKFLQKKLKSLKQLNMQKKRQKAFQLLAYRGFNYPTIKSAIDALMLEE